MIKNNLNINPTTKHPKQEVFLAMLLLLIFVNFTLTVSYVNLSGTNISFTEIVEEEQELEHNHDLLDALINSFLIIKSKKIDSYIKIIPSISSLEVQTPPPKRI